MQSTLHLRSMQRGISVKLEVTSLVKKKFKEELVKKVEADTVLSKAVGIVSRSSKVYRSPSTGTKAKNPLFQN